MMSDLSDRDDRELVQQCRAGHPEAFAVLLQRHGRPLQALISRLIDDPDEAGDVLQEALIHAWLSLEQLDDPGRLRPWLLQVARNRCRDHFKRRPRRPELPGDELLEQQANRYGRAATPGAQLADRAREALSEVPSPLRETAQLHYLGGFSVAELARGLQCPPGTIKRRLHAARLRMRRSLGVDPEEE